MNEKTTKVRLSVLHEHAGQPYAAGAVLDLPATDAQWLISTARAELEDAETTPTAPQPKPRKGDL